MILNKVCGILATISVSFSALLEAQDNYYIKNYTTENGLPHNNVKCIAQDKAGFLWIATWDGLSRFDGYEFKNYYHKPNDSTSLPFFLINKLCVDCFNNLWVLDNSNGLALYNRKDDNFIQIKYKHDISFKGKLISDISTDTAGKLWVIGEFGLKEFEYEENKFIEAEIIDKEGKNLNLINSPSIFAFDNKGNIWIKNNLRKDDKIIYKCSLGNNDKNINKFKITGEYSLRFSSTVYNLPYNFLPLYKCYLSNSGRSWILSNIGLFCLDTLHGEFREYHGPIPKKDFSGNKSFVW